MAAEAAGAASGIFAVVGTVVGAALKAGGARSNSQRRANGKVFTQIEKIRLELECINVEFWKEEKAIEAAQRAFEQARRDGKQEWERPAVPVRTYHRTDDFKARQDRVWELAGKAEQAVSDNVLELSAGFSRAYWRFYRQFVTPDAPEMVPHERYKLAEKVLRAWQPKLRRTARGGFWLWLTFMVVQILAGIAAGAALAHYWPDISPYLPGWLDSFVEKLGLS